MKFKKPSGKAYVHTATLVGGGVAGGMASRGLFGLIHEKKATTEAEIKKERNWGYAKRAGIIAVSGTGVLLLAEKTDLTSNIIKGVLAGVAIAQSFDLAKDISEATPSVAKLSAGTSAKDKFLARTLGLNCACDQNASLGRPRQIGSRMLRMPVYEEPTQLLGYPEEVQGLDAIFLKASA